MKRLPIRFLVVLFTFVIGICSVGGWFYFQEFQKNQILVPDAEKDLRIFNGFNRVENSDEKTGGINQATKLAGIKELRETRVRPGDIEVRVWRGFGLSPLEGVILNRTNNQWSAQHLKTDNYYDYKKVELKQLNSPKSGWETFWKQIADKGILTLRDPSELNCDDSGLDGISYVVEINQDKIYRTYKIRSDGGCDGVQQMDEIGEVIGLEFDSGLEKCKTSEWFACMTLRKTLNQTNQ